MIFYTKDSSHLYRTSGRTTQVEDCLYLGYSGSYMEFDTTADAITLTLKTDRKECLEEHNQLGHLGVWVNGLRQGEEKDWEKAPREAVLADRICLDIPEKTVKVSLVSEQVKSGAVKTVRLIKMSEAAFGLVGIVSVETEGEALICPTLPKKRSIQFIGDSITCGYGNEGKNGVDIFHTGQENPLDAYAVLTADKVDAEYQLVSWSGIGIITNYVDPSIEVPREEILMPWLYPYHDVRLEERLGDWHPGAPRVFVDDKMLHDFTYDQSDLIVIFLGTNDDSYVRTLKDREDVFAIEYERFIHSVHTIHPNSRILCCLGTMGRNLCRVEEEIVKGYAGRHPELAIRYVALPQQLEEDGIATDGHPSKITHNKVSEILRKEIRDFMGWE